MRELIKIEKNLNYISFFSPSKSQRGRGRVKRTVRVINYPSREIDGQTVQPKSTIKADTELGLPTTADRDKYMAFMSIVTEMKARMGKVENPIRFTTHELLKRAGLSDAGLNFDEANQFLERMVSTTIKSEYSVYFSGPRRHVTDIFHVFNRVVLAGQELADGTVAQMNYVFLSDWQLDNINSNYTFPVDHCAYRELRRDVAKAVFGHLHTWFFASRGRAVERKYIEFCELLDIQCYKHLSKARQVLEPSFQELIKISYLRSWELLWTADRSDFKLVMTPGEKIMQVVRPRLGSVMSIEDPETSSILKALTDRGIREADARRVLFDIDLKAQPVADQIEWFDDQIRRGVPVKNPPGFLVACLRDNWRIPADFETSRKRLLRNRLHESTTDTAEAQERIPGSVREMELRQQYWSWQDEQIEQAIATQFPGPEYKKKLNQIAKEVRRKHPDLLEENSTSWMAHVAAILRTQVGCALKLPTFEEFIGAKQPKLF
jgi:Replication initiator protein A